jgi:hypothetical protein
VKDVVTQATKIKSDIYTAIGKLTDTERIEVIGLHRKWIIGEEYILGEVFQYNNKLYRIEQSTLTATETYTPGGTGLESLFTELQPEQVGPGIITWFEPTSTNYYKLGDLVRYTDGKVYESIYNGNNVWSPASYPQGWAIRNDLL